ncbi:MAG: hypothetical protein ACKV0T_25430 [Planctomycetales bacterium]
MAKKKAPKRAQATSGKKPAKKQQRTVKQGASQAATPRAPKGTKALQPKGSSAAPAKSPKKGVPAKPKPAAQPKGPAQTSAKLGARPAAPPQPRPEAPAHTPSAAPTHASPATVPPAAPELHEKASGPSEAPSDLACLSSGQRVRHRYEHWWGTVLYKSDSHTHTPDGRTVVCYIVQVDNGPIRDDIRHEDLTVSQVRPGPSITIPEPAIRSSST